ncbi:MAG: hypothetical protein LBP86_11485, partial [Azoarcus sp.]|nr:hypothetical protein [Azoarcus sp.]
MPAKNEHNTSIPPAVLAQASDMAGQLSALLQPYAVPLTPDERRSLAKMGDKTYAFVEKAYELAKINPGLCPAFLDLKDFEVDFADAGNKLEPLLVALQQLVDTIGDIQMLAGSEAYHAALSFYSYVKVASAQDISGAKAVYTALRERFPRAKRRP